MWSHKLVKNKIHAVLFILLGDYLWVIGRRL